MPTKEFGPYGVQKAEVPTGVLVKAGDTVRTVSEGTVDFGGAVIGIGALKLDADGDLEAAPNTYPAPSLRKNSLICKVGEKWYQGGVSKSFTPGEGGEIILRTNDNIVDDNSRGWSVKLFVTTVDNQAQQLPGQQQSPQSPTQYPIS